MDGGCPDTCADVWMRAGKAIRVESVRGMGSGVVWAESATYDFREDGTLARLAFYHAVLPPAA